jgi:hypothetical protein
MSPKNRRLSGSLGLALIVAATAVPTASAGRGTEGRALHPQTSAGATIRSGHEDSRIPATTVTVHQNSRTPAVITVGGHDDSQIPATTAKLTVVSGHDDSRIADKPTNAAPTGTQLRPAPHGYVVSPAVVKDGDFSWNDAGVGAAAGALSGILAAAAIGAARRPRRLSQA